MVDFEVPRWLRNPHLQTLGAAAPFFAPPRSHRALAESFERIPIPGGFLHAKAWWQDRAAPAVVIVHGIGGSTMSSYVVRLAVAVHRAGYHAVRLDLRGAGASIPDVPSLYHAGLTSDLDLVLAHLGRDARVRGVVFAGFSGGGSLALKKAGQWGKDAPSAALGVVAISAPLDYLEVSKWMDAPARIPYRFHVLRGLSTGARAFASTHPDRAHYRPHEVKRMSSFRTYDGSVIVPMHGFPDVDTYYREASPGPWLDRIEIPALIVHAMDDPMVPAHSVEPWLAKTSAAVKKEVSRHGGHLGWVSGFDEQSWVAGHVSSKVLTFLGETCPKPSS